MVTEGTSRYWQAFTAGGMLGIALGVLATNKVNQWWSKVSAPFADQHLNMKFSRMRNRRYAGATQGASSITDALAVQANNLKQNLASGAENLRSRRPAPMSTMRRTKRGS